MTVWTTRAWFTVEDAASLLKIRRNSLYAACAAGDFPCVRFGGSDDRHGWFVRIPAEALRLRLRPETKTRNYHNTDEFGQLELPLDVSCLVPVRRFRNTREIVRPWHYEDALYRVRDF